MLRNPENGDVIVLRATCIAHKSDNFDDNQFKDEIFKDMMLFMLKGAEKASFIKKNTALKKPFIILDLALLKHTGKEESHNL